MCGIDHVVLSFHHTTKALRAMCHWMAPLQDVDTVPTRVDVSAVAGSTGGATVGACVGAVALPGPLGAVAGEFCPATVALFTGLVSELTLLGVVHLDDHGDVPWCHKW